MENRNRIEALVAHAQDIVDPEANRRTLEIGYGKAAEIVARAHALVEECYTQYLVDCLFWGYVPVLEPDDIRHYATQPALLREDIAKANAANSLSKRSLRVALVTIERMFGAVAI